MSTEEDGHTLTRKQLRELRLTGSTPVINGEDAAAAATRQAPAQPPAEERDAVAAPAAAAPAEVAPAEETAAHPAPSDPAADPSDDASSDHAPADHVPADSGTPLTRRAARAQERGRTGSVPVVPTGEQPVVEQPVVEESVVEAPVVEAPVVEAPVVEAPVVESPGLVSGVPTFASEAAETPRFAAPAETAQSDAPVEIEPADAEPDRAEPEPVAEQQPEPAAPQPTAAKQADDGSERPMVGAAFGIGVKKSTTAHGAHTAFDDLLETGSAGPHKTASTLIFTPSPGAGSLSGPVASTGELLITGTYALPDGMGSQGHALGTTDGKDVDAVLIDGELAPASSPTPIAASSAISTSKPAGEVIRPPMPDKGNKLTLTLAIVAGGLALALAAALIIAFTTGVLG